MTNTFSFSLYEKLKTEQGNLFLSSLSIQTALAMVNVGARNSTRKLLTDLLGERDKTQDGLMANGLWAQTGYKFNPVFVQSIREEFDAEFSEMDYVNNPDDAVNIINNWVSSKTNNRITNLISREFISNDTRLILTNAIYFKEKWAKEFDAIRTTEQPFYGEKETKVQMMRQHDSFPYFENEQVQTIRIPYKRDGYSIVVVLPRKDIPLSQVEDMGEDVFSRMLNSFTRMEVELSFPRFKIESSFALKKVLTSLGAGEIFSGNADFSGISEEKLAVSEVVHKAFVQCDEEGTEAAAATAVGMFRMTSMTIPEVKIFNADHPFLFFICHNGNIVFNGRLVLP